MTTEYSYRKFLKLQFKAKKQFNKKAWTLEKLSLSTRIQTTYLSKVFSEGVHLNTDQLYSLCEVLEITGNEKKVIELLREFEICQNANRKKELKGQIDTLKNDLLQIKNQIKAPSVIVSERDELAFFYLEPLHQVAHCLLSMPKFSDRPSLLKQALGINTRKLDTVLSALERVKLVEKTGDGKLKLINRKFHLPKDSNVYHPWRTQLRLLALNRMPLNSIEENFGFSVVLSGSKNAERSIRERFLEFIKEAEKIVSNDKNLEEAFILNFDLTPWGVSGER